MRFGKRAPRIEATTPRLRGALIQHWDPPERCDWSARVSSWPMLRNDALGICVPAGALHLIQCMRANAWGSAWQPSDDEALALYRAWAGYDGTSATDHGTVIADALAAWGSGGVALPGAESVPWYAHINPLDILMLKAAIAELGGALVGLELPDAAVGDGDWLGSSDPPNPANGHCVVIVGYDQGRFTVVTWGGVRRMSLSFWLAYADEAWAIGSGADWLSASGRTPSALDWDSLSIMAQRFGA